MKSLLLLIASGLLTLNVNAQSIHYPITQKITHEDKYFDTIISDPYQWLEDDNSEATTAWVQQQNKTTTAYLSHIPFREAIVQRFSELYNYEKTKPPIYAGNYVIVEKNNGLQNQYVFYYRNQEDTIWNILLNPNTINPAGTTSFEISGIDKKYHYVAFNVSDAGSDWATIIIKDIASGVTLPDTIRWVKFSNVQWYGDGFFYSRYPEPEKGQEFTAASENHSVYFHKIGTPQSTDKLIYEDKEHPRYYHYVSLSDDDRYLFLYKSSGTNGFETYVKDLEQDSDFLPLYRGFEHKSTVVGNDGSTLYVLTDIDAPNYKVISQKIGGEHSNTIIAESTNLLESVTLYGNTFYAKYLENANNKVSLFSKKGKYKGDIPLPDIGTLEGLTGYRHDKVSYFHFSGFTDPGTIYICNLKKKRTSVYYRPELKFNPDEYICKQVWYPSKDSTLISMFIVHKEGLVLDGSHPTYLYGYGGFNINLTPTFSTSRIMLLENNGVFAMPNLRGGGEYGEEWHHEGMLMQKQNVFDDFIYAAKYLIQEQYTSPEHLGIGGGSNGGLLVGACMTQQPELYNVALPSVGVMDMLKFHKFTVGWGWIPEYGSSEQSKEMFRYLYGYSPYHQLHPGTKYPATLVFTADHDDRVVPAHSFKFAARLQEYHKGEAPVLIHIDTDAGHGAGKPTSKIIATAADQWSFFFWNTGVKTLYGR